MEWFFCILLGVNGIITIYQIIDIFDSLYWKDYPIWKSIFMFVLNAWENMEDDYNLAGRIIVAVLLSIITLPAMILTSVFMLIILIVVVLPMTIFNLLFKKK